MVIRPDSDHPFFKEWESRKFNSQRSLIRTLELVKQLGIPSSLPFPAVAIVGSKGKGSTVAVLSRILVNSGLKVGAITSPAYINNRERIRLSNRMIPVDDYIELSGVLAGHLDKLSTPNEGYLSPAGAYLAMGLKYFIDQKVDIVLIEEGMGGESDEISLFNFDAIVLTSVFMEHAGVLGNTELEIARNLLGIATEKTAFLFAPEMKSHIEAEIDSMVLAKRLVRVFPNIVWPGAGFDRPTVLKSNSELAATAAKVLIEVYFCEAQLALPLEVNIPGRYMLVNQAETGFHDWFIDSANNPVSIESLLRFLNDKVRMPDQVFACFSNDRNQALGLEMLGDLSVTEVEIKNSRGKPGTYKLDAISLEEALLLGRACDGLTLFLGSIWFISNILEAIGANLECW